VASAIQTDVDTKPADVSELIARAQQQDPEAFCRLYRVYEARLLGQAIAICGDRMLAEDLGQEVIYQAWKSLHRYNGRCLFFTWLCSILLHRHRSKLRQKFPLPFSKLISADRESAQDLLERSIDRSPTPDQSAQISEGADRLLACVQSLPKKHRDVVFLRFYVDDSMESIAAALGVSIGTVKSRLYHGLEKLRKMRALLPDPDGNSR
jgi:RNA polymerase sigma-70 factor, ECF subfamily